jgi:hypothetical protein
VNGKDTVTRVGFTLRAVPFERLDDSFTKGCGKRLGRLGPNHDLQRRGRSSRLAGARHGYGDQERPELLVDPGKYDPASTNFDGLNAARR